MMPNDVLQVLNKLSSLADDLDNSGELAIADELEEIIQEVADKAREEAGQTKTTCLECNGTGAGIDSPFCDKCKGSGEVPLKEASLTKTAFIRKRKGKYCVISRKGKTLGCYKSRAAAVKRLQQIEFFKHNK